MKGNFIFLPLLLRTLGLFKLLAQALEQNRFKGEHSLLFFTGPPQYSQQPSSEISSLEELQGFSLSEVSPVSLSSLWAQLDSSFTDSYQQNQMS